MNSNLKKFARGKLPLLLLAVNTVISFVRHSQSRRKIKNILSNRKTFFVELGAGEKKGTGNWITLDMSTKCDVFWDLRNGIPFPDQSVSKLYSSHLFEHLTFKEGQLLLDECIRVLAPGGTFSICVPNARLYIEAYLNPDTVDKNNFFDHRPAYNNTSKIDAINYMAYMDGHHKYMFDEENLVEILRLKRFNKVQLRKYDPNLDRLERDFESIYAEAEK
ncbi:MAG: methyltransferase domain-containing protein [Bacteriovorax sp.]|nr:methyltransferase domain-containing protein [Bacteriovorax sp.]